MRQFDYKAFTWPCAWGAALAGLCAGMLFITIQNVDIRNGLSQNTVYQILQDRKGFMWFGTQGRSEPV